MTVESIRIEAPADKVWAMVSDVTRMGEWSPETKSAEWLDGATGPAVGARFRGHNKRKGPWSTVCTVTASASPREFAFVVGNGETAWRYELEPSGDGCLVRESFEILKVPGRVGRLMTKVGTGVSWDEREGDLAAGMRETLRRLKASAEA